MSTSLKQQNNRGCLHRYERRNGTERSYVYWARRYILFRGKKHPNTMGAPEVRSFCSHLAEKEHVGASTQNQAFNAMLCEQNDRDAFPCQAMVATLLYGSGLRLMVCHRLPAKDIDIEQRQLVVRRSTYGFARNGVPDLIKHLERIKALHHIFTEHGDGTTSMKARCSGQLRRPSNSPE